MPLPTRDRAPHTGSTISLRSHLLLLVVGTLLPVVLFAVLAVHKLSSDERAAAERRLGAAAKNLAVALDQEMSSSVRTLQVLATSDRLERDDLAGFYAEAKRAAQAQPTWHTVILARPDGEQVFNVLHPLGQRLGKVYEPDSLARAVATRAAAVGRLARGAASGNWAVPVRVPVVRDGAVRYVLSAVIGADALTKLVQNEIPVGGEWTASLIDDRGLIAARTVESQRFVGQPARASMREQMAAGPEGIFRDTTRRGVEVYAAFSRAASSGWNAHVAVPTAVVEGPGRRSVWAMLGGGLALLMVSGVAALALSRRIASGIASAAAAAQALAQGERPHVEPSPIREVTSLRRALESSADLLAHHERERNEHLARAEAANRLKDEFLITVSHELRTPLQAILGWVKLLRGGKLDAGKTQHALAIIERNTQTQTQLVNDLLDMSGIVTGKVHLNRERVDFAAVVAAAVDSMRLAAESKAIKLSVHAPPEALPLVGDPNRLQQVVWNLISNAVKFTPAGGNIAVTLGTDAAHAQLCVRDSGVGIKAEFLPHVFERFRQADGSPSRRFAGLGIGLAIVRHLVELHGGSVHADSAGDGAGATFTVRLPLAVPHAAAAEGARAVEDPAHSLRGVRVLVIDDETDALELVTAVLGERGAQVRTCTSVTAALDLLRVWRPDAILCDIGMPERDGYQFLRELRQREAELGGAIPAAALTAYAQTEDRAKVLAAGYRLHVAKPVEPAALINAVAHLVRGRPAMADADRRLFTS